MPGLKKKRKRSKGIVSLNDIPKQSRSGDIGFSFSLLYFAFAMFPLSCVFDLVT